MNGTTCKYFLNDTLKNIIDRAIQLNSEKNKDEFKEGLIAGYYHVLSHIFNQIEIFEIIYDLDEYLKNFDPDDLLTGKAKSPFKKEEQDDN
ncbi:MAG: hypothetical protein R2771_16430 [Saprospiraceae bacterium]